MITVDRLEIAQPFDMVVMQVAEEDVHDGFGGPLHQRSAETDQPGAGIKRQYLIVGFNFDARRITADSQRVLAGSGMTAAYSPETQP